MATADVDDTSGIESSRVSSYRGNELVIGTAYERLVSSKLADWGAGPAIMSVDPRLELALVTVRPSAAANYLESNHKDWVEAAKAAAEKERYAATPLDILVRCLRLFFADEFGGWVPTLAKNRLLGRVAGSYVIDGGGRGTPLPQPYVIDGGGSSQPRLVKQGNVVGRRPAQAGAGAGARVGVVDTKLLPHPWLDGGFVAHTEDLWSPDEWSGLPNSAYHATFVTGLVLNQAPGATVVARAALDTEAQQDSWAVAQIIATLAEDRLDVLNLSFGCATDDGQAPLVLTRALQTLAPRTLVVAAAGNHDRDRTPSAPTWPAAMERVVAVGAVDSDGRPADFSPNVPWIDALAPGVGVVSTWGVNDEGVPTFAQWNGTSFAAAVVSGAVAAKVGPGVDPMQAWATICDDAAQKRADYGRMVPIVPLGATVPGWPPGR